MRNHLGKLMSLAAIAVLLPACGGTDVQGPSPAGSVSVNGPAVNSSVEIGSVRIYTLSGIVKDDTYLVRTSIAPGGALTARIYRSLSAYKAGEVPVAAAAPIAGAPELYEATFTASQSGDHVVVLSGTPSSVSISTLYFYNLRVMSGSLAKSFAAPVDTGAGAVAEGTGTVLPDHVRVYSGQSVSVSGSPVSGTSYTVLLTSSTVSVSYPQVFIYQDSSLSLNSILYSAVSISADKTRKFLVSDFTSSTGSHVSTSPTSTALADLCSIPSVSFSTGAGGGPFILLRGVSRATFTLSVGP